MGELIILKEWKRQRDLEELAFLESELDAWLRYYDVKQEFFIFDSLGNAIQIFPKEVGQQCQ